MKKIIISLSFMFFLVGLFAQNEKSDTTKMKIGKREIIIIDNNKSDKNKQRVEIVIDSVQTEKTVEIQDEEDNDEYSGENIQMGENTDKEVVLEKKKENYHARKYSRFAGLNLGFNKLFDREDGGQLTGNEALLENKFINSSSWTLNILEGSVSIVKKHILLTSGLGFEWRKYGFINDIDIVKGTNNTYSVVNSSNDYQKNKLKATYIQVPLLLEFNTSSKPKRGFYFATGLIGGFKLCSKMEQEYEISGSDIEKEMKGDYALSDFQCIGTLRLGFGRLTFITNVDLYPVFDQNVGLPNENVGSVNFGIQLLGL